MKSETTRQMGHSRSERAARMAPPLSWRFPSPRGGADRLHRGLLAYASRGGMSGLRHLGPGCAGPALMGLILLAFAALGSAPAQAQTPDATDATLSEIVVNTRGQVGDLRR